MIICYLFIKYFGNDCIMNVQGAIVFVKLLPQSCFRKHLGGGGGGYQYQKLGKLRPHWDGGDGDHGVLKPIHNQNYRFVYFWQPPTFTPYPGYMA